MVEREEAVWEQLIHTAGLFPRGLTGAPTPGQQSPGSLLCLLVKDFRAQCPLGADEAHTVGSWEGSQPGAWTPCLLVTSHLHGWRRGSETGL